VLHSTSTTESALASISHCRCSTSAYLSVILKHRSPSRFDKNERLSVRIFVSVVISNIALQLACKGDRCQKKCTVHRSLGWYRGDCSNPGLSADAFLAHFEPESKPVVFTLSEVSFGKETASCCFVSRFVQSTPAKLSAHRVFSANQRNADVRTNVCSEL
jgi:hypothetical protein